MENSLIPRPQASLTPYTERALSRPGQREVRAVRERAALDSARVRGAKYVTLNALQALGQVVQAEGHLSAQFPAAEGYFRSLVVSFAAVANEVVQGWFVP